MKVLIFIIPMMLLAGCGPSNKDVWSDIDYAKVARENYRRENDSAYTPPHVLGCVDDDLYNCPTISPYR
jgi:hypothetical protein